MLKINETVATTTTFYSTGQETNWAHHLELVWKVGDPKPEIQHPIDQLKIEADGPELSFIEQNFRNLPMLTNTHNRKVIWRGEMARFILDNLT